jgi:hypothetical protein
LGEHCRALQWLSLHGLTTVTDVGIGHLAPQRTAVTTSSSNDYSAISAVSADNRASAATSTGGCPLLQHLDVTGLYMLSDGAVREFARAGLQVTDNCFCLNFTVVCVVALL